MPQIVNMLDDAQRCISLGLCVIPIRADGSKAPALSTWAQFQDHFPTPADLRNWFGGTKRGIAVLGGSISGNLEVLDFDDIEAYEAWLQLCDDHDLGELVERLVWVQTPSGGRHGIYRCDDGVEGSQKLARTKDDHALIETKAEGGYVVAPPSPAYCHEENKPYIFLSGSFENIPNISAEERRALLSMARILDEYIEPEKTIGEPKQSSSSTQYYGIRPGEDYNERGDYEAVLERHGWTRAGTRGGRVMWRRPGKNKGISATTNYADSRLFWSFSTNSHPFEAEKSYTPMGVYTTLEHGGDYKEATKALAAMGYGTPTPPRNGPAYTPSDDDAPYQPGSHSGGNGHDGAPLPPKKKCPIKPFTDLGNAECLVEMEGEDIRFCFEWGTWLCWDGRRWAKDKTGEIYRHAKRTVRSMYAAAAEVEDDSLRRSLSAWARKSESRSNLSNMIALAQSEKNIPVLIDQLDRDPWLLCCENGTIDLRTGLLRPHERFDMITKLIPVKYDPEAECPVFLAFLERVIPDPAVREFLQRGVGYSLTGSVSAQCLFFLFGKGANGKSTFVNVLLALLGDYAMQAAPDILMSSDKQRQGPCPEIAGLVGARFVATSEVDEGRRLAEGLVKQITGGEPIRARFLHQDYFEFMPTHKLWFSANHKPVIRGGDEGIWRRIKLVPFNVTIPKEERDPDLVNKLTAELPGILAWAVRGCMAWNGTEEGSGLTEPAAIQAATDEYRSEMDVLSAFLTDCCVLHPTVTVIGAELYAAYVKWAEDNGDKPIGKKQFGSRLQEGHRITPAVNLGPKHARGWTGIALRSNHVDNDLSTIDKLDTNSSISDASKSLVSQPENNVYNCLLSTQQSLPIDSDDFTGTNDDLPADEWKPL